MIAHVGGLPVEEALLPLASWTGAGLVLARAWLATRRRRADQRRSNRSRFMTLSQAATKSRTNFSSASSDA